MAAMSGGTDSSVAALLLKERGHEVLGVTLNLWSYGGRMEPYNRCCSLEVAAVARQLGIEHYFIDYGEIFEKEVVEPFIRDYSGGKTPNPCIRCNTLVRFPALLAEAERLGCDYLTTGHHARIIEEDGAFYLLRGRDPEKDQSYFLYRLGQRELAKLLFPIGDYLKEEVFKLVREARLLVKPQESQDLCFIPEDDYRRFLLENSPNGIRPGEIVDTQGRVVGHHQGLSFYTIGQRRGLGLAALERLYVVALDPQNNRVIVGPEERLYCSGLIASQINWIAERPSKGEEVQAKIRYRSSPVPARVTPTDKDRVKVIFGQPQRAVTPGQAVVLYRDERVLGGGVIGRAIDA